MHIPQTLKNNRIRTLFNTPEERHAFVIGFGEGSNPLPAKYLPWADQLDCLKSEYQYYSFGRGCGLATLLILIAWLIKFCVR